NLRSSLAKSTGNAAQKAEAYLTLAYLYFEDEQFVPTKKYLDSTLMLLPPTDERYADVNSLAGNLTEIAKNLETIQLQDSLIAMSKLTQEERFALATEIKKQQDEARRKALLESSKEEAVGPGGRPGLPVTGAPRAGGLKSDFFAYDDRSVKRGVRDFERIWGNRPLEDNWRRSTGASGIAVGEEAEQAEEVVSAALTEEDV
ncbi:hypothetical protein RZS08_08995, partial [Arthrospira platensis SPKY1]|nr:hypothetical protein [Arthrospira platensis SPKY1]